MRYSGGKEKIAGKVAAVLQPHVDQVGAYWEPFLGGASVFARIKAPVKFGSDANPWLMCLWQAAMDGWVPPTEVSEDMYADLKARKPMEPTTAAVGFGASYGGKWFGGYARGPSENRNFAAETSRSIVKKVAGFGTAFLACGDYDTIVPPIRCVIYCDPPYAGTLGYGAVGAFDSAKFWESVRRAEGAGWPTFVSEYAAPADFDVMAEFSKKVTMTLEKSAGYPDKGERIFRWRNA